ncbi:MAG: ankyrin repeat domain-containing protein [Blastocatellia bacterium]
MDKGADPNAKNNVGATALMLAAGDHAKVKLLLNKGADVNARSNSGATVLIIAAVYAGAADTVRALLDKGVDANAKDSRMVRINGFRLPEPVGRRWRSRSVCPSQATR